MSFSYDKFLRPLTSSDRNIIIIDDNGKPVYTINPYSILNVRVSNNLLQINLKSKNVISIPFSTTNESKNAIVLFQNQVDLLIEKTPGFIDKQIENYVDSVIVGATGGSGTSGTSGTSGESGTSGSSGTSGEPGTSGSSGTSGESGTSGVTGATGPGYEWNFVNGLSINSLDVSFGGTISTNTVLVGDSYDLIFDNFDSLVFTSSVHDVISEFVSIDSNTSTQILANEDITISASGLINLVGDVSFNGLAILGQVSEKIEGGFGATDSVVTYDFNTGGNWYHSSATNDWTANFINLPTEDGRAITATIIVEQGPTGYIPNLIQIEGVTQTVKYSNGTFSPSTNKVDIIGFSFIRLSGSWVQVFGQIGSFS